MHAFKRDKAEFFGAILNKLYNSLEMNKAWDLEIWLKERIHFQASRLLLQFPRHSVDLSACLQPNLKIKSCKINILFFNVNNLQKLLKSPYVKCIFRCPKRLKSYFGLPRLRLRLLPTCQLRETGILAKNVSSQLVITY